MCRRTVLLLVIPVLSLPATSTRTVHSFPSVMYQLTQHQISSALAGETVILQHAAGRYYGLDEVGTLVWQQLQQGAASFDALKETILAHFDVDEPTCSADLRELLTDLTHEKLVEKVG